MYLDPRISFRTFRLPDFRTLPPATLLLLAPKIRCSSFLLTLQQITNLCQQFNIGWGFYRGW